MFRIFPQDLKVGDIILSTDVEGEVLSVRNIEKKVEVNVKLQNGSLEQWSFGTSDILSLITSVDQLGMYEVTIPDFVRETTDATIPELPILAMDSTPTLEFDSVPTLKTKSLSAGLEVDSSAMTNVIGERPTIQVSPELLLEAEALKSRS